MQSILQMRNSMKKALIAMSGGVDSSVAALLTKESGDDCIGATMKLFHNEDVGMEREKSCCSLDDVEDARNVCYRIGIRYYVFNFSERFREDVMERFVQAYEHGCTYPWTAKRTWHIGRHTPVCMQDITGNQSGDPGERRGALLSGTDSR